MIVSDKAELKRCVRRAVKCAPAVEVFSPIDWLKGPWGVEAMLRTWLAGEEAQAQEIDERFEQRCVQGMPLEAQAAETFAALSGMDMPLMDIAVTREREKLLGRVGYAQLAIERAGLKKVFSPVSLAGAREVCPALSPLAPAVEPLLALRAADAAPARYGTHFSQCAQAAHACMDALGLRGICYTLEEAPEAEAMLRYCVAPVCEDRGAVLHLRARGEDAPFVRALLGDFPTLRMIADLDGGEAALFAARGHENVLPVVGEGALPGALRARGTRFVPYVSGANQPGQLIGRWQNARAAIAQAFTQLLLPLARTGYVIHSEDIETYARALMGENVLALYHEGGNENGKESCFYD